MLLKRFEKGQGMSSEKNSIISFLPNPSVLKDTAKRIALLDAVLMQEWEYRYYSFNSRWNEGEEMSSMRDGSGNEFYILFRNTECCIKIIDKEINNTKDILKETGKIQGRGNAFIDCFLSEPAFDPEYISFLFWNIDGRWKHLGSDKTEFLNIFLHPESEYRKIAEDYYERDISDELLKRMLTGRLEMDLFLELNPELDLEILKNDLKEIGISV